MGSIRFPSTNVEAEQVALGCALLDAECAKQLVAELTESDFTYEPHRIIFRAIKSLCQRGLDPDPITVHDTLQTWNAADECGGVQYLLKLQEIPPALSNFTDYLAIVKEAALRHCVWELAQQLAEAAVKGNGWQNLVGQLQALTEKATVTPRSVFVPLKDWQPQNERTPLVGDLIGSGELVLLYARPKAGKSILCANLVKGVAEGTNALGLPCRKGRVGVIALEDLAVWHERLTELEANGEDVFVAPIPLTFLDLPAIKQAITELQLTLLIVDPLALFLRPLLQKERASLSRDYDAVYSALGALREVTQQTGCTIVLVHHERKESAGAEPTEAAALGSTALSGAVDVGLQLDSREQDGERRWRLSWWGRSVTAGELWLRLRPDLLFEPTTPPTPTTLRGRAIAALCEALKERPYRYTELVALIREQVGCGERTAKAAITAAERQGLIRQRPDKFYELLDTNLIESEVQKVHAYSPLHHLHQQLSSANGASSANAPVCTNCTNEEVQTVQGSKGLHHLHQLSPQVCAFCGNKLSEISATPTCPFCWATGDETVARCTCGEPLRWAGVGRALCPRCSKHWRWANDRWEPNDTPPTDSGHAPESDPTPIPEALSVAWQPNPDPTRSDHWSPEADHNEPTEPPSDLPKVTITDVVDIRGHDAVSAKNPIDTSTFGFTDTRTQDTLQTDDTDAEVTVRKIIGHFGAAPMDAERQVNRDRDDRDAKNPSGTGTFCGQPPLTANDRDDRHDRDLPDPESGLEVQVTCPRCGAWRRVPPDDPRCPACGEVMRLDPEGDPPEGNAPTPADPPTQPDQPDADFVAMDAWLTEWASDPPPAHPTVYDLETLEAIPVADLPSLLTQEAVCLRCGHRKHAIPTGLLPPLCPACRSLMQWASDPPSADPDPLSLALERLTNLSDQLAEKEGGQP
jgi:rubrerythrin